MISSLGQSGSYSLFNKHWLLGIVPDVLRIKEIAEGNLGGSVIFLLSAVICLLQAFFR